MIRVISVCMLFAVIFFPAATVWAQNDSGIDTEALIDRILAVYWEQRDALTTVTFDVVLSEGEMKDKEGFVEKERFDKKVYLKFQPDTIWFHEEYLAYYKDGEQKSEKDLRNAEKDRRKKKESRKSFDISYPLVKPFFVEDRPLYDITYEGTAEEPDGRYLCHVFAVQAIDEADTLLNGTWYFDSESFQLARVDFSPAKLVKKTMFKLNELDMTLVQGPNRDGYWLPERFEIAGKGKAAFLIGVSFAGHAYYRSPIINTPVPDSLFFEEEDDD